MKTYSRDDWHAAQEAWLDFSPEWREYRHQAAMRGILFPPSGSRFDSWDDDQPSQRAILIRAIRETPTLVAASIARSRSWSEVIGKVIAKRDDWREELTEREWQQRRRELEERPTNREAAMSVGSILERIAASRGVDGPGNGRDAA